MQMTEVTVPGRVPAGATEEGDGIAIGAGRVRVDAFIDFLCPFCKRFELSSGSALAELADGLASVVFHPMNFLDAASTTRYSTRAAAASGCAADQGRYLQYAHELFSSQPPEGSAGLSDAELAALGAPAGLDLAGFASCLSGGTYLDWPPYVTARAIAAGVEATPTVLVAGLPVTADASSITAAVEEASRAH
jgi:protein-disulfide isomerase